MPISYSTNRNGRTPIMEGTNGDASHGGGIRSPPLLSGSPITTPSPRRELSKNKKAINSQRTIDEMRSHIAKLKSELDSEKAKYKQLYRDKIAEIRQTKDKCEQDKEHALSHIQIKLEQEKLADLNKLREHLNKEKDTELRQLLRYKEDELKQIKTQMSIEKDDSIKVAMEMQKRALTEQRELTSPAGAPRPSSGSNSALIIRLQREMKQLKDSKRDLEEQLRVRTSADSEKAVELRKMKKEHRAEITRLVKEHKQEGQRDMQQLRKMEVSPRHGGRRSAEWKDSDTDSVRYRSESTGSTTPVSLRGSTSNSIDGDDEVSQLVLKEKYMLQKTFKDNVS